MATNEDYAGREQSQVKHYILQHYLERFAHIIGSKWTTITYVDCFSGPWESQTKDHSDTSFAIALQELRKAVRPGRPRANRSIFAASFSKRMLRGMRGSGSTPTSRPT